MTAHEQPPPYHPGLIPCVIGLSIACVIGWALLTDDAPSAPDKSAPPAVEQPAEPADAPTADRDEVTIIDSAAAESLDSELCGAPPDAHYIAMKNLPGHFNEHEHGAIFPFIEINGVKFHHWAGWYHFAGTNARTLLEGTPPKLTYRIPVTPANSKGGQQRFSVEHWGWIKDDLERDGPTISGAVKSRLKDMPAVTGEPVYIDAQHVPAFGDSDVEGFDRTGTELLGEAYPYLEIEGVKLDYNPSEKWFYFAGEDAPRAMWLEVGGDARTPPKRLLGGAIRSKHGESLLDLVREVEMEQWNPLAQAWEPSAPMGPPVVPPRPDETE